MEANTIITKTSYEHLKQVTIKKWFTNHYAFLLTNLVKLDKLPTSLAKDIIQEIFLKLMEMDNSKFQKITEQLEFPKSYLLKMAKNYFLDFKKLKFQNSIYYFPSNDTTFLTLVDHIQEKEVDFKKLMALQQFLRTQSKTIQELFQLLQEGYDTVEIAEIQKISEHTIRGRRRRTIKKFEKKLGA